jgi:hypothetical protein
VKLFWGPINQVKTQEYNQNISLTVKIEGIRGWCGDGGLNSLWNSGHSFFTGVANYPPPPSEKLNDPMEFLDQLNTSLSLKKTMELY